MKKGTLETKMFPDFKHPVTNDEYLGIKIKELHEIIFSKSTEFEKEEALYCLMSYLITNYAEKVKLEDISNKKNIDIVCSYLKENFTSTIFLEELTSLCDLNKYKLIRSFTKEIGITPYQYLSTIRINHGKLLLQQGNSPLVAALESGFTDQSHFTRFFKNFTGLTPSAYQKFYYSTRKTS